MSVKLNSTGGGSVTLDAPSTASNLTVTLPSASGTLATTDGGNTTFTSITDSGNLNFTGTGNRITGDMSNATVANRIMFQTSTTNGATSLGLIPNGTGTTTGFSCFNNQDPTNASLMGFVSSSTEGRVQAGRVGSGTYLPMTFYTGGSEVMRIDTSGNVGIGTTTSLSRLTALGSSSTVANGASTRNPIASIRGGNDNNRLDVYVDNSGATAIMGLGAYNTAGAATALAFYTGASVDERMRIDSSGNVGIGTTSPSTFGGKLSVVSASGQTSIMIQTSGIGTGQIGLNGSSANLKVYNCYADGLLANGKGIDIDTGGNVMLGTTAFAGAGLSLSGVQGNNFIISVTTSTNAYNHQVYNNPNGNVGYVQTAGSSCSYVNASDYRLKENVKPLANGLATVMQLKPVEYNWKVDGAEGQGFLAHELQAVIPQAATGTKDEVDDDGKPVYQGIDPRHVVAFLTAAIQELKAELDELKAKVN